MSISDPLDHLGSMWYPSEPLNVPYSQFLGWDFFAASYSKTDLVYKSINKNNPLISALEHCCCKKQQKSPNQEAGLGNRGHLKILNGTKLVLDGKGNQSDKFKIILESFI